jgi:hypothetical protein
METTYTKKGIEAAFIFKKAPLNGPHYWIASSKSHWSAWRPYADRLGEKLTANYVPGDAYPPMRRSAESMLNKLFSDVLTA